MKTLKERHADRARRKVENRALSDAPNTGNDRLGTLASQLVSLQSEAESLSPADQAELRVRLENGGTPSADYAQPETFPMAGIGVVNPFVVPVGDVAVSGGAQSGNGGNADPASVSPADALSAAQAAAAWGTGVAADTSGPAPAADATATEATDPTVGEDGKALTKEQLKAVLDARTPPVKYETDANVAALQALVRGA